jgi:hypothetical protein
VKQRALERESLSHPPGEAGYHVCSALGQFRAFQGRRGPSLRVADTIQPTEKHQILVCGEIGVEMKVVGQHAYSGS